MISSYETLADAYRGNLKEIIEHGSIAPPVLDPLSPASRFGARPRGAHELLGHGFRVANPRPSLLKGTEIKTDSPFLFGQFVWFIAGSKDLSWLSCYAPHAQAFSHDGNTLCGSFGSRIFGSAPEANQIRALISLLKRDPGTRRGLVSIAAPSDLLVQTKEFPCCSSLHFLLRDHALHLICTMRAQQALTIFPYDSFLFVGLLHVLASELNVAVGSYTHLAGTLHFYENELATARRVSESDIEYIELPPWTSGLAGVDSIVEWEVRIRRLADSRDRTTIARLIETMQADISTMEGVVMTFCALSAAERLDMEYEKQQLTKQLGVYCL